MSVGDVGSAASHGRIGAIRSRLTVLEGRPWTVLLVVAWVASTAFVARRMNQGWLPHDEGYLAQTAQRVLNGQVPHRDFSELYTGGLTFVNAGVFWIFGENLIWLRLPLFILFVAFVPCVYAIARRFLGPVAATLVALLAAAWSVPNYPAALPSWYLLFFSVFGAFALIKHLETGRRRWLVIAGVFGGLSVSTKIVGITYLIAVLLYLIFVELESRPSGDRRGISIYDVLLIATILGSFAMVAGLVRTHAGGAEIANFLLPVGFVGIFLIVEAWRARSASTWAGVKALGALVGPFALGVAIPVIAVTIPYAVTGSIGDLFDGVFVSPASQLRYAYSSTPGAIELFWALPLVMAFFARLLFGPRKRRLFDVGCTAVVAILLISGGWRPSYLFFWRSARELAPLIPLLGVVGLVVARRRQTDGADRRPVVLLLLLVAFGSLIQFPFGAPIYFCYIAPLVALAAVASMSHAGIHGGVLPAAVLVAFTVFGFAWLGLGLRGDTRSVVLDKAIASIRVSPRDKDVYLRATRLLERHSTGRFIFAGPDAPELYYLSGLENPTRSLFDYRDQSRSGTGAQLLRTLAKKGVTAIAINLEPPFSDPLRPAMLAKLRVRYPHGEHVGNFDIRWR